MASSIEVTLTLGYASRLPAGLHEYLTSPLGAPTQSGGVSTQHLDRVCGGPEHPRDLPGSGQAGTVLIYAGCIRRGNPYDVIDYLRGAPWGHTEAVVVIHDNHGPAVIERLGCAPSEPGW